ncbi:MULTISPECIES: TetR/AcrR family transcriptional regulator [unclassified Streptomyces]|uniref:TetR/AcrR family transcriptional regulator n=1 Tax=unclassified Streptomyces TaxID=2593676 RepID=UPI000223B319|nr:MULTISPECIES: TetR/AcrR family transcriptional regulator [unclassified Streptomyces]AEN08067.1 transcriptional regulator, TetR family [Streptomyces sp. SirexAA-E]MYR68427.1 TetR family transcriptional regulator [Streptomyces sp. SID4939]MYS02131.1 TetR family transcriptional regulator [Streptomyces sp. SID4940]MYT66782.1 TetR family transcriptional regulator [Streptomyces sp. SID8357]MYT83703.1 TetR family transcriptional regulator [Streptomyces sp. SID8360]
MDRVSRQSRVAKLPPRERILDAAEELFAREGIKAVGVQAIADRAETTKMALYRHFATKDALVEQWLRIVAADYTAAFDRLEAAHPDDPRAQILGLARFIADGLSEISHRGCPFINSIAELPDRTHPARRLIEDHKADQARRLTALCVRAGLSGPDEAAAEITFVLEGAQVSAQNGSIDQVGERLMRIVETVLDRRSARGTAAL